MAKKNTEETKQEPIKEKVVKKEPIVDEDRRLYCPTP